MVLVEPGLFKTEMVTGDNKEMVRGRNGDGPNAQAVENKLGHCGPGKI